MNIPGEKSIRGQFAKISDFLSVRRFAICCVIALIFKYFMIQAIPLRSLFFNVHDDALMVSMAENILNGEWVTPVYINKFLAKGCGYPLLIAAQNLLGLSLRQFAWLLYSAGCLLMMQALAPIVKSRRWRFAIFVFLLFFPEYERSLCFTYRTWTQYWAVLFTYGSLIAVYLRKEDPKRMLLWTIPGIFGAVFYFHAFESGFWIVGLYAGTALVVAILLLTERKTDIRQTLRSLPVRIAAILLPVIFIAFASCIIRHINYDRYGVNAVSIFTGTNFPRFIKALYSVKPNNNDYNLPVAVPTETIRRICKVSPTLAPYETSLIAAILTWGRGGRFPDDNEIESGWFYWCILQLFEKKSFEEQQHIFEHAALEIKAALRDGRLESRPVMPSILMAPWRPEFSEAMRASLPDFLVFLSRGAQGFDFADLIRSEDQKKHLSRSIKFNIIYRDTFWLNETDTPLRKNLAKIYTRVSKIWRCFNPFLFHVAAGLLLGQIVLALWTRNRNIISLTFIPLLIHGGICVLVFGLLYTHISSFPTFEYLHPAACLLQISFVVLPAVFVHSLFAGDCANLAVRLKELKRNDFWKHGVFYLLVVLIGVVIAAAVSSKYWLAHSEKYVMRDLSPATTAIKVVPVTNESWTYGSSKKQNMLLLPNTRQNMEHLDRAAAFFVNGDNGKHTILSFDPVVWNIAVRYEGSRITPSEEIEIVLVGSRREVVDLSPLTDKNWLNGSSRSRNVLLAPNTEQNRRKLENMRIFKMNDADETYRIAGFREAGEFIHIAYLGPRIRLDSPGFLTGERRRSAFRTVPMETARRKASE